ncbi:MAG: class I SAM-dependent RNA methyltransferase [Saprospiraceae bacterium]
MKILAKTMQGLESVLAEEIEAIGGTDINILKRAVSYKGDKKVLYKSNVLLRTALRILVPKKEFRARDEDELYNVINQIPWETIMTLTDNFAIDCTSNSEIFTHSKYIALKSKDAIVDRFVEKYGKRPNVNIYNPTYRINIHVRDDVFTLSMDSSGSSLHMRGYRINTVEAPINEVMAAGLVLLSDWRRDTPLLDPMCGSGTIIIEAAKIALNHPAQKRERAFTFKKWKSFDEAIYNEIWEEIAQNITDQDIFINGQDKSLRAVKITEQNIEEAGLLDKIHVKKQEFFRTDPREEITIITNPPYDERLKEADINKFYTKIATKFEEDFKESLCWFFSANLEAMEQIKMQPSRSFDLLNASLPAKFACYET